MLGSDNATQNVHDVGHYRLQDGQKFFAAFYSWYYCEVYYRKRYQDGFYCFCVCNEVGDLGQGFKILPSNVPEHPLDAPGMTLEWSRWKET